MKSGPILAHPDQSLAKHLRSVARLAKDFSRHFGAERQAQLAGLLHDLGKADDEFQKRMAKAIGASKEDGEKRPHAHHGAALALAHQLWPVAFAINGHHAGLHDRSDLQQLASKWTASARKCEATLTGEKEWSGQPWPLAEFGQTLPAWFEQIAPTTAAERDAKMRAVDFYTRMLFSALVDADRLDTEEANRAEGSQTNVLKRKGWRFGPRGLAANGAVATLNEMLDSAIGERAEAARRKNTSEAVKEVRAQVLASCKAKAIADRGVFTLAVPTGGGKTLASVAFALRHIAHHNQSLAEHDPRRLRRIIVVIPYLNIIQQTSRELRMVFGDLVWVKDAVEPLTGKKLKHPVKDEEGAWLENSAPDHQPLVLEHHSQATDPEIKGSDKSKTNNDTDGYSQERPLRQLAAENWDAPIIVTTSVQFFDSLFSRSPSDARKLHNICQSVLIFDEVQTLPPLLLQPVLDALKELTSPQRPYGCSLVLCTATQPALEHDKDNFEFGFENVTRIIAKPEADEHFAKLKRVEYHGLEQLLPKTDAELAEAMFAAPRRQALAILNTRKQARALFEALKAKATADDSLRDAVFHLSTWMYPAHRLQVLAEVTKRLSNQQPCFFVSTQCIEAGVDVDFPAVWRAFGPYDSMVQAAGRCNRNGALKNDAGRAILGQVQIFQPADAAAPKGVYASAMQTADLLRKMGEAKPNVPASFETYFRLLYQATVPDLGGCAVQSAREKLHFEEVSHLFRFIDADTVPLLIGDAEMAVPGSNGITKVKAADWILEARKKTYLTADEWRHIQPYVVSLSFPESKMTQAFLKESDAGLVFKEDDTVRGLRLLKAGSPLYHDSLNGCGLDLQCQALRDAANYLL
jgi:CRISPR-associated endonuclease/helicase Cas3